MLSLAGKLPYNFSMRRHILQVQTPQPFIRNPGGPRLQQPVSRSQDLPSGGVLAGLQNLITGQIDAKRLARSIEMFDLKLGQQFGRISLCLRQVVLGQGDPDEAGQNFTGKMKLSRLLAQGQGLAVTIGRFQQQAQLDLSVPQVGQGRSADFW